MSNTQPATELLTDQQLAVIDSLILGASVAAIATTMNLSRSTIYNWMKTDDLFMDELHTHRHELYQSHCDRLRTMVATALDILDKQMRHSDPRIALAAIKTIFAMTAVGKNVNPAALKSYPQNRLTPAPAKPITPVKPTPSMRLAQAIDGVLPALAVGR